MLGRVISLMLMVGMILSAAIVLAGCGLGEGPASSDTSAGGVSSTASPGGGSSTSTSAGTTTSGVTTTSVPPTTTPPTTAPPTTAPPSTAAPTTSTTKAPATTSSTAAAGTPAKEYVRIPTKEKIVALTFDAAYDPAPLEDILAALSAADADATFFLTGEFIRDFPSETKQIVAAGHPIGNHSYSHPDFTEISDAKVRDQLQRTAAAIEKIGADDPRPLFRPPYGARDKRVLRLLASEGYVSVYWTIDTLDWKPERTAQQIRDTVLNKLEPGAIVLMHVGGKQTAKILPELLDEIEARGYRFVDLREALS